MRAAVLILMCLVFLACKKSENQKAEVTFTIQTRAGESDYTFLDYFTNGDGKKIRIELLQFYMADVRFITKKGKEVVVEDIALIKISNEGTASISFKVVADDYTAIRFAIGVPADMNEQGPSAYNEVDHPLSITQNTYWGMNSMYRFLMLDGKYDLTGDAVDDGSFSYHTGYDDSYREVEIQHAFSFDRKEKYAKKLLIDVEKFFSVSGSVIDVEAESNYHGEISDLDLSLRMSDNFSKSFSIED